MRRLLVLLCVFLAGCATSVGPPTIARDRFDYIEAISDSWKRQMLLNLVKVRYSDVPVFLDVTSVLNAYGIDNELHISGQAAPVGRNGDTFLGAEGITHYTDHPTITYVPVLGDKFAKSFMSPIPVSGILLLIQSGYPADFVLRMCVSTANGLENSYGGRTRRVGSEGFYELITLLREDQAAGGLGFEPRPATGKHAMALVFRPKEDEAMARRHQRIVELLHAKEGVRQFDVGYGSFATDSTEIALLSRSMFQVMVDVASYIDPLESDVAEGRVHSRPRPPDELRMYPALVEVKHSAEAPADAWIAIQYRKRWFWIDDRDDRSKAVFSFLMLMFSLTETGSTQAVPVLTVPAR
jgi:hypothetical protein